MYSTTYNFTYGTFDLRDEVKVGTQRLAKYTYSTDRKYNLQKLDYGNQDSVQYEYDDEERLIKQTYEDGAYVTYTYDNSGELVKVYDSQSGITTAYTYDLSGRTVKVTESGTNHSLAVTYAYDEENNLEKQVETVNGTTHTYEYTYDEDNRIIGQTVDDVETIVTYDEDYGRTTGRTVKVGNTTVIQDSYTYKPGANNGASGQVETHTQVYAGYTIPYTYTYDDNGNIVEIDDGLYKKSYVYDKANQLIRENNQLGGYTHTWSYDNSSNILTRTEYAYTTGSLEGVTPTDTVNYTYGNSNWGDLLTAYDGQALSYDTIGNLLSDGEWTYTWKHGRQLATASRNGITWNYTYDANGMRTKKDCGILTFTYVYDGSQLVEMTFYNDLFKFTYDAGGAPLTVNYNGTTYYYVTNLQGDVVKIIDKNRNVVAAYSYDAWGKVLSVTGSMASTLGQRNPLRYRGYVYDQETYLYYLQSRYYDPEWGRFINADAFASTGQGLIGNNMFAYCGNNPISRTDDGGFLWETIVGITVGAAVGVVTAWIGAVVTGQDFTWADAGVAALAGGISFLGGWGLAAGAVLNGTYTMYSAYKNGASIWGALGAGFVSGALSAVSFGDLSKAGADMAGIAISGTIDLIFGTAFSCIDAAISETIVENSSSSVSLPKKGSALDVALNIGKQKNTRVYNGGLITISPKNCSIPRNYPNRLYCYVEL